MSDQQVFVVTKNQDNTVDTVWVTLDAATQYIASVGGALSVKSFEVRGVVDQNPSRGPRQRS